ncbi:MAG: hypothetical protein ABI591_30755 [Kofleriaceae bacterium]
MPPRLHTIQGIEDGSRRIAAAAFGDDQLVLADASSLEVLRLAGSSSTSDYKVALDQEPKAVHISATGTFVLAIDPQRIRVWAREAHEPVFEAAIIAKTSVGAAFARLGEREVLLYESAQARLEAFDLPSCERFFGGGTETFLATTGVAIAGGTRIALVGYYRGEGKHSFALVPTEELTLPPELLFTRFRKKRPIADYAYRLAVGPCGVDALVVFRDPEDDEEPDDEDDEQFVDSSAHADVRGLHGFYLRGTDGALLAKRSWDGPVKSSAHLAATRAWIAADCGEQIALVPLAATATATTITARWLAASSNGSRVLVQDENGTLSIIDLRS